MGHRRADDEPEGSPTAAADGLDDHSTDPGDASEGRATGSTGPARTPDAPDRDAASLSRRDILRRASYSGVAVLGGGLLGHELIPYRHAAAEASQEHYVGGGLITSTGDAQPGPYGHAAAPPPGLREDTLAAVTHPAPFDGRQGVTRSYDLSVTQRQIEVGDGVVVDAWTYDGTVPGPIIRATEGDALHIHMANRTSHAHNVHLHGRHSPRMDGWEPIPPGADYSYEVVAEPFGLHPYHCHTAPLAEHVGRGLYGAMIVDPPGGRPDAHEVVLILGGWDVDGDGRNELVCWNGVAGFFHTFPIKVPVGEPVRVYLLNMLEYEPVGSFHLHAQTFDVIRSGTSLEPHEHTDTITLGQGERAILEFTLPEAGRYMFHPHQHHLADRGAMGWFAAI